MTQVVKRIGVTGGAGQIAYSLLFRIAGGELLGEKQPIALHILELPEAQGLLQGVVMELIDCAFPLLKEIKIGSDPYEVFQGVDYMFLVGAKPRGPGMERKDLLAENGKIFIEQGKALAKVAPKALTLVVGNPCNTNCLIALKHAPNSRLFAMTRLDENRAKAMLAEKAGVAVSEVSRVTVWGNHSTTQVPDFLNAQIGGVPAMEKIRDHQWLKEAFIPAVQKRGATVIAARGKSSAASAANAALGAMKSLIFPTSKGEWYSMGLLSDGNPYGIKEGIVFSFPCRTDESGRVEIVKDVPLDASLKERMALSEKELLEEKELVRHFL